MTTSSFIKHISPTSYAPAKTLALASGLRLSFLETAIVIDIPFPSTEFIYYRRNSDSIDLSNDLRLLYQNNALSSSGITSLLLLGANVPPLSPYKKVFSLAPGFRHTINTKNLSIESTPNSTWSQPAMDDTQLSKEDKLKKLTDVLDESLRRSCPTKNPIVLFSGGVDSSIIASRIAALGWHDATLVHCTFGNDDQETPVAKKIAAALSLNLEIVNWRDFSGFEVLENAAMLYRQPFVDISTVPTHALTLSIVSRFAPGRTIFDGTGADGAFGLFNKSKRSRQLYKVPASVRQLLGTLYQTMQLWKHPGRLEYYIRVLNRSAMLDQLACSIANNPLCNIAYSAAPEDMQMVSRYSNDWINGVAAGSATDKIALIDIGLVCAAIFAQKNKSPFDYYQFNIEYPFLQHASVDFALNRIKYWPESKMPKGILKQLLATSIPSELVYRQKSGFLAPLQRQFANNTYLQHLDAVRSQAAPLNNVVNQQLLIKMINYLKREKPLPLQSYTFLWAIAFANAWLTQIQAVSHQLKSSTRYESAPRLEPSLD